MQRISNNHRTVWKIYNKLDCSSEQTEEKLRGMFDKLLKSFERLSPSVTKSLEKSGLSLEERRILKSTNPDNIQVESDYRGPRINGPITRSTFVDLIEAFQTGQVLHEKYVYIILHQARTILKQLPNFNRIDLSNLRHVFIIGDLHGQLTDLLHIFNQNGIPAIDNPYIFNGDFVDRGSNSVEVFLLLLVALILYPSSIFLNRGNHEDYFITLRYGFESEINRKYQKRKTPLLDLFKDIFSWLPLYSIVDTGISKFVILHGGISNRVNLKQINSIPRNRYTSLIVQPESKKGGTSLTLQEDNEYQQVQDLLWCDPDPEDVPGCRYNSNRRMAWFFGPDITEQFLSANQFSMLIRSHEAKENGYEFQHNNKVLTVFSASNYNAEGNRGAVARWDYKSQEPRIMTYGFEDIPSVEKFCFNKQVTLFEDPVYQSLLEKIIEKKILFETEFKKSDRNKTGRISSINWVDMMNKVLQIDFPWLTLRSKFVKEDTQGIIYNTMLENNDLDNPEFQKSHAGIIEDLYTSKDLLMALFNLIDSNHSGFINQSELSDAMKHLFDTETDVDQTYIEELISAMALNKNGKVNFNEFLETFRIVHLKKQTN